MAELIYLNGNNPDVTQVAVYTPSENKWGRMGLTPDEGFMLVHQFSFLRGILFALKNPEIEFDVIQFIQREVEREASGSPCYVPTGAEIQMFGR